MTNEFNDDVDTMNFVVYKMDYEGMDYCFRTCHDFREVQNAEFHRLRKAYCEAAEALERYVKANADPGYLEGLGIEP